MEVSEQLIKKILSDDTIYYMYCNFNNYKDYFAGLSYSDIEKAIFEYLSNDLMKRANAKMNLPIDYYMYCIKRVAKPYNNPTTLTCNSFFKDLKTVCYTSPYNKEGYIAQWELEEFFDTQLYNLTNRNNEARMSELSSMVAKKIYGDSADFDVISHYVSIGYPGFNSQDAYEYIIKGIVDYGYNVNEFEYKSIMEKFASLVAISSGLSSCNIVLSSEEEKDTSGSYYPFDINVFGKNEWIDKHITLNTNYLTPKCVLDNVQTIFHEVGHGVQTTKPYYGSYETLQFAKDLYLEEQFGEEYYDENYWNVSYEADARRLSAYKTMEFLDSFTEKGTQKYKSEYRKKIRNAKQNNSRNLKEDGQTIYSDIDALFTLFAKDAIDNYEIRNVLLQEYDESGNRRLITEFLENRKNGNKDFFDSLIYKHNYTFEEIKENALALMFYRPESLSEKVEIGSKITFKLLDDLKRDIKIKGLNRIEMEKSKVRKLKEKISLILQQSLGKDLSLDQEFDEDDLSFELENEENYEVSRRH